MLTPLQQVDQRISASDQQRERTRRLLDAVQVREARDRLEALDRVFLNGRIDRRQYETGHRVQELWEQTGRAPSLVSQLEPRIQSTGSNPFERMVIGNVDATEAWVFLMCRLPQNQYDEVIQVCVQNREVGDSAALGAGLTRLLRLGLA